MAREEKESESQRPTTKDTEIQATASIPNSATKSNFRHSSAILTFWPLLIWHFGPRLIWYLISNKNKKLKWIWWISTWSWQVSFRVKKFPKGLSMAYWSVFKMNPRLNHLIEILLRKFTFFGKSCFSLLYIFSDSGIFS